MMRKVILAFLVWLFCGWFTLAQASGTNGAWDVTGALPNSTPSEYNLSNGDLTATDATDLNENGIGSTNSILSGQYYFELTCNVVGSTSGDFIGVLVNTTSGASYFGFGPNGTYYANSGSGTISSYTNGNVISFAIDYTNGLAWARVNGGNWNNSGTANPATGTGGISFTTGQGALYIDFGSNTPGAQYTINTGTTAFAYTPPSGFANWYGSPPGVTLHLLPLMGVGQ